MRKKKILYLLIAAAVILIALVTTLYFTRTASPDVPAQSLPQREQGETVTIHDIIGLSPAEAESKLGYPDHDPFGENPKIIGQDNAVNLSRPTIITAACMRLKDNTNNQPAMVVFEVANPDQVSTEGLAALKSTTYESRQQHIKEITGCYTDTIGVFVAQDS
ncbi:hypothetical protein [Gordonia oryzae]|uniref:hypothetical protein n=1 Tax=Gordonia oryzae TaxID=2487349 RepID=UPI003F84FAFC